jgi:hypothetical protein
MKGRRSFGWRGHGGPILSQSGDLENYNVVFYCKKCRRLHLYTNVLLGDEWQQKLEDYDEQYVAFEELRAKAEAMGLEGE